MMRSGVGAWSVLCAAVLLAAAPAWGFSGGVGTPSSGAPGEGQCIGCHTFAGFLNPGILAISAPESYEPGQTYPIVVTLTGALTPGGNSPTTPPVRWGFQATAIDNQTEQGAGSFIPSDDAVMQAFTAVPIDRPYITHKACGLSVQPDCPTASNGSDLVPGWAFEWVAPAEDVGPVDIYATANAANGNGQSSGDAAFSSVNVQIPVPEPAAGLGAWVALSVLAALRRRP